MKGARRRRRRRCLVFFCATTSVRYRRNGAPSHSTRDLRARLFRRWPVGHAASLCASSATKQQKGNGPFFSSLFSLIRRPVSLFFFCGLRDAAYPRLLHPPVSGRLRMSLDVFPHRKRGRPTRPCRRRRWFGRPGQAGSPERRDGGCDRWVDPDQAVTRLYSLCSPRSVDRSS